MTVLTVRLDDQLAADLTARADARNMTKAKLVRKLIKSELALNLAREDEAIMTFDVNELAVIKSALELYLKNHSLNDNADLYFYVTGELAELQVSLNTRPLVF